MIAFYTISGSGEVNGNGVNGGRVARLVPGKKLEAWKPWGIGKKNWAWTKRRME
jgi:hypothetical protein